MKYRYKDTDIYVYEQGDQKISLLQASTKYPLSKFYSEEGVVDAMVNCSYFTNDYVLGRNQGDTFDDAPDQDFYSVVIRADGSYRCDKLASWEERDGITAGFSPSVVLIKDGADCELTSGAISDAKARLTNKNPNTAFGVKKDGKAILVVNSGRLAQSTGLTGRELREFLKMQYDLDLLVLLDGGGSSEMIVNGSIVNMLSDGAERKMFNALAFVDNKATQYAFLPVHHTGIAQGINGSYSHVGTKAIDFGYNKGYEGQELYAPFDCRVMWADTIAKGGTVALQSVKPVKWADGTEDFMTVISEHSNDRPEKGKTFKQGEVYAHMGTAGNVSMHTHIEVQKGKYKAYTGLIYQKGIKANVYAFPNTVEPYRALYLTSDTVMHDGDVQYDWKRISKIVSPVERDTTKDQIRILVNLLRVRKDHSTSAESIGYVEKDGIYYDLESYEDGTYTWHRIADDQWVADNGEWLEVLPGVSEDVATLKKQIFLLQAQLTEIQSLYDGQKEMMESLRNSNASLALQVNEIQEAFELKTAEAESYLGKIAKIREVIA